MLPPPDGGPVVRASAISFHLRALDIPTQLRRALAGVVRQGEADTAMNPVATTQLLAAIVTMAISVPLIQRKVKRDHWYGVRIRAAFESNETGKAIFKTNLGRNKAPRATPDLKSPDNPTASTGVPRG